jgi:hypothetical protein
VGKKAEAGGQDGERHTALALTPSLPGAIVIQAIRLREARPLARKNSLLSRIVLMTTLLVSALLGVAILLIATRLSVELRSIVLAENMQIADARAGQLDQLIEKLHWQLNLIANDEGLRGGDRKTMESGIASLENLPSREAIEASIAFRSPLLSPSSEAIRLSCQ